MLIIYLDTSALLKRYINEVGAEEIRQLLEEADEIATGVITRVETASAVARLVISHSITDEDGERVWDEFSEDWEIITRLRVTPQLVERAACLARQYCLRTYDAVHLASAISWQEGMNMPVTLATFDRGLWLAGQKSGLGMWPDGLIS
jgi:predicted nucleic acid-binding protein